MIRLILFAFSLSSLFGEIHVLFTSALISMKYKTRRQEYLRSFHALKSYGINPWIIEATHISQSFYDNLSTRVFYPWQNKYCNNIGANEISSIRACIPSFPFNDDDIVVKLTGRYWLYRPTLFSAIQENPDADVFLKIWHGNGHFEFTGCFAMRWKHLKRLLLEADTDRMESERIAMEEVVAEYVKANQLKIKMLDQFDILARINGIDETHAY